MSDIRKWLEENLDRLVDRLVDNELSPVEQRELLAALEDEPGGWRRCALAFVEANVWRNTLINVRAEQAVALPGPVLSKQGRPWNWAYGAALAASVLVAFACGRFAASGPADSEVAAMRGHSTNGAAVSTVAVDHPVPDSSNDLANDAPAGDSSGDAAPGWQTVQLNFADALTGEPEAVDVPCLDVSRADLAQIEQGWLAQQDSAVSAQALQTFQEAGYTVTAEMQWWPVEMADGRRVVLPVEQVELRYVGGELY